MCVKKNVISVIVFLMKIYVDINPNVEPANAEWKRLSKAKKIKNSIVKPRKAWEGE